MADDPQPAASPADETLPQWKPPASATRPAITGTRSVDVDAYDRTLAASASPTAAPSLRVGDIIGERYVIEQLISSGGFGSVYRASDRQIRNHQVALKLLHNPAADSLAREGALRELTLIASVSHPSVVQFKDYGWHEGRLWFAMPWYRGQTLAQRFASAEGLAPISRAEARPIFSQLAQGLAAMHKVGVHHHDIKPDNIFLAEIAGFENGLPVLLDLGIASERGEGPKGLTLEYASPETAASMLGNRENPVGAPADVFSLALVLRNLLEPETAPVMRGELMAVLHRRATERVSAPRKRELKYLAPAFARWLDLEQAKRPTAAEFAAELAFLTQPEEERATRKRILRRLIPIVLFAAAVVAVLLLQVRKQKTELSVERQRLSQQSRENEELKKRSSEQLQQLEAESHNSQSQLATRATQNAHQWKQLLERADVRADTLAKKLKKISDDEDALVKERDALKKERDGLLATHDGLVRDRDGLAASRDALVRERDALLRTRTQIEDERNTFLMQRNDTIRERDKSEAERQRLESELARAGAERGALKKEVDELRSELQALQEERSRLEAAAHHASAPGDHQPSADAPAPVPVRAGEAEAR